MTETLKTKFLEGATCYFCRDVIHNHELIELFDSRIVISCFECYTMVEIGKLVYYCRIGEVDIQWS